MQRGVRARLRGQGLMPVGFPVPGYEFVHTGVRQLGDAGEDTQTPLGGQRQLDFPDNDN